MDKTLTYIKIHLLRTLMLVAMMVWGVGESWGQTLDPDLKNRQLVTISTDYLKNGGSFTANQWYIIVPQAANTKCLTHSGSGWVADNKPVVGDDASTIAARLLKAESSAQSSKLKSGDGYYIHFTGSNNVALSATNSSSGDDEKVVLAARNNGSKNINIRSYNKYTFWSTYSFINYDNGTIKEINKASLGYIADDDGCYFYIYPVILKYKTSITFGTPTFNSDGSFNLPTYLKVGDTVVDGKNFSYTVTKGTCDVSSTGVVSNVSDGEVTIKATFTQDSEYMGSEATFAFTKSSAASTGSINIDIKPEKNELTWAGNDIHNSVNVDPMSFSNYKPGYSKYVFANSSDKQHIWYWGKDHIYNTTEQFTLPTLNGSLWDCQSQLTYSWTKEGDGEDYVRLGGNHIGYCQYIYESGVASQKTLTARYTLYYDGGELFTKTTDITLLPSTGAAQVETPVITFNPESKEVSISCKTANSQIFYTTNGDKPTNNSNLYEAPFTVDKVQTIKAIGYLDGWMYSAIDVLNIYSITDASSNGTITPLYTLAKENTKVTLTATPNAGYVFNNLSGNWTVTDEATKTTIPVTVGANNTCTFTMPAGNVTVSALFEVKQNEIKGIADPEDGGYFTMKDENGNDVTNFIYGQNIILTAVPNAGYDFSKWGDDDDDEVTDPIPNPRTITVYGDATYTAVFTPKTFSIATDTNISGGSISGIPTSARYKETVSLASATKTPDSGYKFNKWYVTSGGQEITVANDQFTMPAGDVVVSAVFAELMKDPTSLSVEANMEMNVGEIKNIIASVLPSGYTYKEIHYSSANENIASVTAEGAVTGVAAGQTTITVTAYKQDKSTNTDLTNTVTVTVRDKVATPTITFTHQATGSDADVTFDCTTEGVDYYYTTDGVTDPTTTSTKYNGTLSVSNGTIVKVIAVKTGDNAQYFANSDVTTAKYTAQKVPTPEVKIRGNEVTFTCDEPGVTFYYTTNGNDPTTSSTRWDGFAITNITDGATIKVIATKDGFAESLVGSATYTTAHVVYLRLEGGQGSQDGSSAANAVGSWEAAYNRLGFSPATKRLRDNWNSSTDTNIKALYSHNAFGNSHNNNSAPTFTSTVDNNIIYLVGDVSQEQFTNLFNVMAGNTGTSYATYQKKPLDKYVMKPATISGKYATTGSEWELVKSIDYSKSTWRGWNADSFPIAADGSMEVVNAENRTNNYDFQYIVLDGVPVEAGVNYRVDITVKGSATGRIYCALRDWSDGSANGGWIDFGTQKNTLSYTINGSQLSGSLFVILQSGEFVGTYNIYDVSVYKAVGCSTIQIPHNNNITLNEDVRFEYIKFTQSHDSNSSNHETNIMCGYYDFEFGDCVQIEKVMSTATFKEYDHGYIYEANGYQTQVPHILIYGGYVNDARFTGMTGREINFDKFLPHPEGYKITLKSGYLSTISPGGKQWESGINGAMGSPNTPVKCTITIDVDHAWNKAHETNVLATGKDRCPAGTVPNNDVSAIIAGTHQGNMYGDVDIIIKSGRVGRVVNGTFGANETSATNYPMDSYFGRANILIDPREPSADEKSAGYADKNSMVVIQELYGGGLGRFKASSTNTTDESSTYFYGYSTVTINGGTFKSALYAAGAGGVNGIGDDNHTTNDDRLPYWSSSSKTSVTYGSYSSYKSGTKLTVKCLNSNGSYTNVDLSKTNARIAIHGGIFGSESASVEGIFGGGYGWVHEGLINYKSARSESPINNNQPNKKPNSLAGSMFANANDTVSIITIDGDAKIYGNVYGAGRGSDVYYNYYTDNTTKNKYKTLGLVSGNVALSIAGNAKIYGNVYGAGQGIDDANLTEMAHLYGNTTLTIGGRAEITGSVYGGGANGATEGTTTVNIEGGTITGDVYGGGALANTSNATVNLTGGTITGNAYGGGLGRTTGRAVAATVGTSTVNVGSSSAAGATVINGAVFGCNNLNGYPTDSATVNVYKTAARASQAYHLEAVYGGGNQAAYTGDPTVNVYNYSVNNIFGGGLGSTAIVTGSPVVNIYGGSLGYVYGGGSEANTTGAPTVNVRGGTVVNDVYGGGALANTGNTAVNLLAGTVNNVYGGGLGRQAADGVEPVAAKVGSTTVNISTGTVVNGNATDVSGTCVIMGDVFGCNNLNGTPTDEATVNVFKTNARPGAAAGAYHVNQVFGGGNMASYDPEPSKGTNCNMATHVNIYTCDNSIAYVYGGGNAASAPATNVYVRGGHFDYIFGGGNGRGDGNPGANVGYYTDTNINDITSHGDAYGTGRVNTEIYGGIINHLFGGSNTRGNIREAAISKLEDEECEFQIGEAYAAGNEAYMDGAATMDIGCIPGMAALYGGAKAANINSDVILTISSGTFGKVFGGNNDGGCINGKITVNIEETGCNPIIIGEVYGGGNQAAYPGTLPSDYTAREYGITVNAISFTKIGTIYGGGLGAQATVTGNTTVNVNVVKGVHAEKIGNKIGTVGTIFGGGNAAAVVGNTNVNIGTVAGKGADIQAIDVTIPASITGGEDETYHGDGNVFGGGNDAEVTGKTNVVIGADK